jgi:predicted Fe-S protein YdhL (DUF1289 family)
MNRPPIGSARPGYPQSPCIRQCVLDDRKVCIGCKRTIDEIMAWSTMSAEEQWALVRMLPNR